MRSQLLATVPKAIVHCMVAPAKEKLLDELQEEVRGAGRTCLPARPPARLPACLPGADGAGARWGCCRRPPAVRLC